jgi:hypothetical protein
MKYFYFAFVATILFLINGCHSIESSETKQIRQLIQELEATPWSGPENISIPTLWVFNFTKPMQEIIDIGPPAQDELIDALDKPKILDQVIILLGAVGDEKAVPHIINSIPDELVSLQLVLCANLALTNITVADVIWHHGGGIPSPVKTDPKKRWTDWWEKNRDTFSVKTITTSRRYSNYPNYGIYKGKE